ncbi:alpha/beta fold hydrolase [Synechococcus sp. BSF8S]|uniref:alpha/beta hydrolase n=1 Tax=Synechococcales TaxID=1890424 RepID=UPI0016258F49|nr:MULTISPECIES: alpha/beta fold hydrolase [unclassified Synechococcus]MBC1261659.1 alpha/beta fold hydrolase [Synechococcus sp. BSF8S]MBC1264588.1 alpha/beta fold hydrolase [Synechococcus sp. BSA11S]
MTDDLLIRGPADAEQRLVLLHGWGADADDLLDLGEELAGRRTGVVSLRAPEPHPCGVGRQWYDLQQPEWPGLAGARQLLKLRLEALAESLPLERTVVLGFSQGAAMALDVASDLPVAGVICCSGYPHPGWNPRAPLPPILLTHGRADPVVPYAASEELQRLWRNAGGDSQLLGFPGEHTIDTALFPALRSFMEQHWPTPSR